ncbi:Lipid A export ATP-binding/permease protein MsbA [Achromobacter sp. 2789STDY5608628]|nr:Lipid A export ATP-binding/permease protein MsbA [Achromobacter sp. 2789STDY5608628]
MGWFARQRDGDLAARLTSDLDMVESIWSHFLGVFVTGLAMPCFLLLFLAWLDGPMALWVAAVMPLAALAMAWTQRVARRPGERMFAANETAQAALAEYVAGVPVWRGFGRHGQAWRRLRGILDEQLAAVTAVESRPAPWLALFGFVLEAGFVAVALAGAARLADASYGPQQLLLFLVVALPLYRQLFEVGLSTLLLRFAQRAMQRIEDILRQPPLPEPACPSLPQGQDFELRDVSFAYDGGEPVLAGVSCRIPANGLTAIVGRSGAGKTTLAHLLARLWDVTAGSIRLGGVDVRQLGTRALHERVAIVFQEVVLFSGSVRDNLLIGRPDATQAEIEAAARRAYAHDFIMALPQGYDTRLSENAESLSGGERQRLSIARALLKDAPILLLDEATASVDPSAQAEIQRAIGDLARGRTVVVIAHRLNAVQHADQILVLDGGRLCESGTHAELLARDGVYASMWHRQQRARGWRLQPSP